LEKKKRVVVAKKGGKKGPAEAADKINLGHCPERGKKKTSCD